MGESLYALSWPITWIAAVIYGIIWISLAISWYRIPNSPTPSPKALPPTPISIIIAAHNELENFKHFAIGWLSQEYPVYELILVLDRCSDGSRDWLEQNFPHNKRLKILEVEKVPQNWSPKKWALQLGIQSARYEWMAFTDADCFTPQTWLDTLSANMVEPNQLLLGLGFYKEAPGLLNRAIQFETFYTAFQYIGFANLGLPYMGVGRNMAYTQTFFREAGGFEKFSDQLSGDDDLLVNSASKVSTTTCCIEARGTTLSVPVTTWKDWLRQKMRHVSAGKRYSPLSKAVLGIFQLSHLCFYGGLFVSMIANFEPYSQIGLYLGRIISNILSLIPIRKKIYIPKIILRYPLFDFLIFFYNLLIVPLGLILKPEWKKNLKHPKIPRKTESW